MQPITAPDTTAEARALLAEIRPEEMEAANITSRAVYRPCHEGLTPAQYGRAVGRQFITEPAQLPRWV